MVERHKYTVLSVHVPILLLVVKDTAEVKVDNTIVMFLAHIRRLQNKNQNLQYLDVFDQYVPITYTFPLTEF